jgi:hypothetical protein
LAGQLAPRDPRSSAGLIQPRPDRVDEAFPERRMNISDLAAHCIAACLVTTVTLGSITVMASRTPAADARRTLPPVADLSLITPLARGDARMGIDDMIHVGDGREEGEGHAPSRQVEIDPQT